LLRGRAKRRHDHDRCAWLSVACTVDVAVSALMLLGPSTAGGLGGQARNKRLPERAQGDAQGCTMREACGLRLGRHD
jgi:hypothetical protein